MAQALECLNVLVKQSRGEGGSHIAEHSIKKNTVIAEHRKLRRCLHIGRELSDSPRQLRRSTRIFLQRSLNHKVENGDSCTVAGITQWRRNACLRCDSHTFILVRVPQRSA